MLYILIASNNSTGSYSKFYDAAIIENILEFDISCK